MEHDTAKSMQTLLKLDAIKSLMTSTAEALKVSKKWTSMKCVRSLYINVHIIKVHVLGILELLNEVRLAFVKTLDFI